MFHPNSAPGRVNDVCLVTESDKLYFFSLAEDKDLASEVGSSGVKVTGAGGNGFLVKCDLLRPRGRVLQIPVTPEQVESRRLMTNFCWMSGDRLIASCPEGPALNVYKVEPVRWEGIKRLYKKELRVQICFLPIAELVERRSSHAVLSLLLELSALLHIHSVDVTLPTFQVKFLDMQGMTWNACSLTPSEK